MKHIPIALIFLSLGLKASIVTSIAKIESPLEGTDLHQVLTYHNGMIFEVDNHDTEILKTLSVAANSKLKVELEFERDKKEMAGERIINARLVGPMATEALPLHKTRPPKKMLYDPTNVSSMDKARQMFNSLYDRTKWFTQCFNRAHIWNRQLHKDFGVKSEKIFIFYTRKYRQYDRSWKWWFHVAPMVRVNGEKVVLDREFTPGPMTEYDWEKKFNEPMRDFDKRCKRINKISAFESSSNNRNEYCNILIAPMYYWEPSDLKALEMNGVVKNKWINSEIRSAAAEAFRGWRSLYEDYEVH